jgi:PIN domain nuclease of toxin-antitoxin system
MRVLLDTHVLLWADAAPVKLGDVRELIADQDTELLVSAACSWEIAIKYATGRLPLPDAPRLHVPAMIRALGATAIPVEHAHALRVADLPPVHRDPFDRMLIAQAQALDLPIVTADPVFADYDVTVITP